MAALNWLHFTDRHVGSREAWAWEAVKKLLLKDLEELSRKQAEAGHGPWDVVFFTGDFAFSGQRKEYKALAKELDEIWGALCDPWPGAAPPVLLAVPGNHDLERPTNRARVLDLLQAHRGKKHPTELLFNQDPGWVKQVEARFAAYAAWWKSCPYRPRQELNEGFLPGDLSFTLHKEGVCWRFVGLNTAFMDLKDKVEEKLRIHIKQLDAACGGSLERFLGEGDPAFLFSHHPPSWLTAEARMHYQQDIYPPHRFIAHLCGHLHVARAERRSMGFGDERNLWQGTSLFGLDKIEGRLDRRYGYSAGRLEQKPAGRWCVQHWPRLVVGTQNGTFRLASDPSFELSGDFLSTPPMEIGGRRARMSSGKETTPPAPIHAAPHEGEWSQVVSESSLWKSVDTDTRGGESGALKTLAVEMVQECERVWDATDAIVPEDPWRDRQYPSRVVRRLERFIGTKPGNLEAEEVLLLLVAPFIREAVRAAGSQWLVRGEPEQFEDTASTMPPRLLLEQIHRSRRELIHRADELGSNDRRAVALWMMQRAVERAPELWVPSPEVLEAVRLADRLEEQVRRRDVEWLNWQRLTNLARCVGVNPEVLEERQGLKEEVHFGGVKLRLPALARLLSAAGQAALDIRRVDEAAVEHIGLGDGFQLGALRTALQEARWSIREDDDALEYICQHPVVDFVLRELVARADEALQRIHQKQHSSGTEATLALLRRLPARFSDAGVKPAADQARRPCYQMPHIRFRLEHNRIRDLLMGQQLYTDPVLAIRELYQNALDACRRKRARQQYQGTAYDGRISFRQISSGEQPYIECEDNGVGMSVHDLEQLFAMAGRRFVDAPEFLDEMAEWRRRGIEFYPNSQFGIGVLSYFMIAERIEIVTRPVPRQGRPGPLITARISSASGLFHLTETRDDETLITGGTRVRLFLKRVVNKTSNVSFLPSAQGVLSRLVWVAEFETVAHEEGRPERRWAPLRLTLPPGVEKSVCSTSNPNLWWFDGDGPILADGIATEERYPLAIVNLRGRQYPELTIDRRHIVSWKPRWAAGELEASWRSLIDWSGLTFEFLWKLEEKNVSIARKLFRELRDRQVALPLNARSEWNTRVRVDQLGCFAGDLKLLMGEELDSMAVDSRIRERIDAWRLDAWMQAGVPEEIWRRAFARSMSGNSNLKEILERSSSVVAEPGDMLLMSTLLGGKYSRQLPGKRTLFVQDALRVALTLGHPPREVAQRLMVIGVICADSISIDPSALGGIELGEIDLLLVSRDLDGQSPWLSGRVPMPHVLAAAERSKRSLDEVASRLRTLAPVFDLQLELGAETLAQVDWKPGDLQLLSRNLDGTAPWLSGRVSTPHMLAAAERLKRSVEEVASRLRAVAPVLGLELEPGVDGLAQVEWKSGDLQLLSQSLDGSAPWLSGRVPARHVLAAAEQFGRSVEEVASRLRVLSPVLGLELEPGVEVLAQVGHEWGDLQLVSQEPEGRAPWLSGQVPARHVLAAAERLKRSVEEVASRLRILAPILGLELEPGVDALVRVDWKPGDFQLLSLSLEGGPPWLSGRVPARHMLWAAERLGRSVEEVLSRLRTLAPVLGLELEPGVEVLAQVGREWGDLQLLSRDLDGRGPWLSGQVPARHMLMAADRLRRSVEEVASRLRTFAPVLGLELAPDVEGVAQVGLEPGDFQLLSRDLNGRVPWLLGRVPAPHVLAVAEGSGRSVEAVVRRLRTLAPAWGLELEPEVEALVQIGLEPGDLQLLSRDLDGSAPWLSGRVSALHVLAAVAESGRTVEEAVRRLRAFAPVLGLELEPRVEALVQVGKEPGDLQLLSRDLDGNQPWLSGSVPAQHVLTAAERLGRSVEDVARRLVTLAPLLGLSFDFVPESVRLERKPRGVAVTSHTP
ncbi:hypothetical protein NR798_32625 [Archangium gephyra]|uniref:wHTH domain-containing protein n=1 Tax=Archangium gephyra TaxID=48 RepID=UPI0035D425FE